MRQVFACPGQCVRRIGVFAAILVMLLINPVVSGAVPYAELVMDMRTGEVLQSKNADTRLNPASLTKMMTLYIAFEAIEHGEISLDSKVTITKNAAAEPPSKLGLRPGQTIALRYLIRAAAIKSANDAATAIGEAIEGSEAAFARRMNRTAKALGMTRTNFVNANGLTASGHLSTAADMVTLGRHLFFDYPQYYNLFSRRSADAGVATVRSTNRRFLDAYEGADGIKTGYTSAAGFNLVASAQRGNKRVIGAIFGGTSTAMRNARMAELLDLGFRKSPNRALVQKPGRPTYVASAPENLTPDIDIDSGSGVAAGKTIRLQVAVAKSLRPKSRPGPNAPAPAAVPEQALDEMLLSSMEDDIAAALAEAQTTLAGEETAEQVAAVAAEAEEKAAEGPAFAQTTAPQPETLALQAASGTALALGSSPVPLAAPRPAEMAPEPVKRAEALVETPAEDVATLAEAAMVPPPANPVRTKPVAVAETVETPAETADAATVALAAAAPAETMTAETMTIVAPKTRPEEIILASAPAAPVAEEPLEVVTRVSTSGGREWAINVGNYPSRYAAERVLLQTALIEMNTLDEALRKVIPRKGGFDANFVGMTEEMASLACRRLTARQTECSVVGP